MHERFKKFLNRLEYKVEKFAREAQIGLNQVFYDLRYRRLVTPEAHKEACSKTEMLTGDVMSFLNENLTEKLKPVYATDLQVKLFQFLMESADDDTLFLEEIRGRANKEGRPFLAMHWANYLNYSDKDVVLNLVNKKEVHLITERGVQDDMMAPRLTVLGAIGTKLVPNICFLAFPRRVESAEEVRAMLGILSSKNSHLETVNIYNERKRIVLVEKIKYRGGVFEETNQYFFLGQLESGDKPYWLYGKNSLNDDDRPVLQCKRDSILVPVFN